MFFNAKPDRVVLLFRTFSQWCQIDVNLNEAQATSQSINSDEHVDQTPIKLEGERNK